MAAVKKQARPKTWAKMAPTGDKWKMKDFCFSPWKARPGKEENAVTVPIPEVFSGKQLFSKLY